MRSHFLRAVGKSPALWGVAQQTPAFDIDPSLGSNLERISGQLGTFTRASSKKVWDGTQYVTRGVNELPLSYDPVAGKWGYLLEGASPNGIRNNTGQGAAVGNPGTLPTNWRLQHPSGGAYTGTREIVGFGVEDGIDYVDIRVARPATGPNVEFAFSGNSEVAAAPGEQPVLSVFVRVVGGSMTNLTAFLDTYDFPFYARSVSTLFTPTSAPLGSQRFVSDRPASAYGGDTTAMDTYLTLISSGAFDVTLRIGWPQIDRSGFASSPVRTAGSAVTRAEDIWRFTGTQFSDWYDPLGGTIYAETRGTGRTGYPAAWQVISSAANRLDSYQNEGNYETSIVASNALQAEFSSARDAATFGKEALRLKLNDFGRSFNGAAPATDASGSVPSTNLLRLGNTENAPIFHWSGWLHRWAYFPPGAAQNRLQEIST